MKANLLLGVTLAFLIAGDLPARTWTAADGRKMEAEFVSSDGENVTIKKPGRQAQTFSLKLLSDEDQEWVADKLEEMKEKNAAVLRAKGLTGKWEKR